MKPLPPEFALSHAPSRNPSLIKAAVLAPVSQPYVQTFARLACFMAASMLICFCAWAGEAQRIVALPAPTIYNNNPLVLALASAGFKDGMTIDAVQPRVLWYQLLPRHTRIREGKLILNIASSSVTSSRMGMRVNVNGSPRAVFHPIAPVGESALQTLHIALGADDLKKEAIAVELLFEASEQVNRLSCRDLGVTNYMHVLPDSKLVLTPTVPHTNSIGAYIERLPEQVDLTIPAQAGFSAIHTAWHMSAMLRESGHTVRIRPYPASGHIVVANIAQWPDAAKTEHAGSRAMQLITTSAGQALFVAETMGSEGAALNLMPLMRLDRFSARLTDRKSVDFDMVPLSEVLSSPLHQESFGSVQWDGYLSSRHVPRGYVPSGLSLRVIAGPLKDNRKANLHIFINEVLTKTVKLRSDGSAENVEIALPKAQQRDRIRIRLRIDEEGRSVRCLSDAGSPVQILPGSSVELKRSDSLDKARRNFSLLSRSFVAPFTVYLDRSALQNAAGTVGLLSRLTERYDARPERASLASAHDVDDKDREGLDFVWFSAVPPQGVSGSLSLAGPALRVSDHSGTYTLPMAELRGMSVAAVVQKNSRLGLWMRPGDADFPLNVPETLAFGDGDVAFFDDRAVVLTTNDFLPGSASPKVAEMAYVKPLMNKLNWFSAALWVAAVLVLIGGVRIAMRLRRK